MKIKIVEVIKNEKINELFLDYQQWFSFSTPSTSSPFSSTSSSPPSTK